MEPVEYVVLILVACVVLHWFSKSKDESVMITTINKAFDYLARSLAPPPRYSEQGRQAAHSVFKLLNTKCHAYGFKIGRTVIAGSMGKGTGISYSYLDQVEGTTKLKSSDFDCVVFINDMEPPFDIILEDFVNILKEHPYVRNDSIKTTKITVQFTYCDNEVGDIHFDLLPAANYVKQTDKISLKGQPVGEVEAKRSLANLQGKQIPSIKSDHDVNPLENRLHSSSFAEKTVECVKKYVSNEVILHVVRLAKFWNANLEINQYVPARSYMIELIAIHCQLAAVKKNTGVSVVDGFRRFLKAMSTFSQLSICLDGKVHPVFRKVKPVIIDPVNQYNNLAESISQRAVDVFESEARKTKKKLDTIRKRMISESHSSAIMKDIFLPSASDKDSLKSVVVHSLTLPKINSYSQCKSDMQSARR